VRVGLRKLASQLSQEVQKGRPQAPFRDRATSLGAWCASRSPELAAVPSFFQGRGSLGSLEPDVPQGKGLHEP